MYVFTTINLDTSLPIISHYHNTHLICNLRMTTQPYRSHIISVSDTNAEAKLML